MVYISFGENIGGIIKGQLIDASRSLSQIQNEKVHYLALVPFRNYWSNYKIAKEAWPDSTILPAVPYGLNWKLSLIFMWLFFLFSKHSSAICRGVPATLLALKVKKSGLIKKICYDGRGAIGAEWEEFIYEKHPVKGFDNMYALEKKAVIESDFRLAVSRSLVHYWQERLAYNSDQHVIIPCSIDSAIKKETSLAQGELFQKWLANKANKLFVYAGSVAGNWQAISDVVEFMTATLKSDQQNKLLFLSPEHEAIDSLSSIFPDQVERVWLDPSAVHAQLSHCDFGIAFRKPSVSSATSSPTKVPAYLNAGLSILISPGVGDFTDFVKEKNCGSIWQSGNTIPILKIPTDSDKQHYKELAQKHFSKNSVFIQNSYKKIIAALNS